MKKICSIAFALVLLGIGAHDLADRDAVRARPAPDGVALLGLALLAAYGLFLYRGR